MSSSRRAHQAANSSLMAEQIRLTVERDRAACAQHLGQARLDVAVRSCCPVIRSSSRAIPAPVPPRAVDAQRPTTTGQSSSAASSPVTPAVPRRSATQCCTTPYCAISVGEVCRVRQSSPSPRHRRDQGDRHQRRPHPQPGPGRRCHLALRALQRPDRSARRSGRTPAAPTDPSRDRRTTTPPSRRVRVVRRATTTRLGSPASTASWDSSCRHFYRTPEIGGISDCCRAAVHVVRRTFLREGQEQFFQFVFS
jgi:hypothetical protein